ncbi:MAG TPA: haloacid dehalogenase type II, partial [Alphaproteobacteria bacterium]|nr:haloacid dehalogenase type II [Alphaproteobacteria bacterium]
VVDWRSSIIREGEAFGRERSIEIDWNAFAVAWRAKYQPAMQRVRAGEIGFVKLDLLHRQNLDAVLEEFGLGDLDEAARRYLNLIWHRLQPWPDAVEGLTRLKRRYIIATLSNGNVRLMLDMAKHAGLPWDMILGAEVAQAYKPQPDAYLRSIGFLDLAPEQCLMVAAHNSDLVAAGKCGLRTAFVPRPTEYGPEQDYDRQPKNPYDVVADDFLDLADKLGC